VFSWVQSLVSMAGFLFCLMRGGPLRYTCLYFILEKNILNLHVFKALNNVDHQLRFAFII
jgi:hypothetical protein